MRTTAILIIALIFATAQAATFNAKVSEMMKANERASDAVAEVERLLLELRNSIQQEQIDHQKRWDQQQVEFKASIAKLTNIWNTNVEIHKKKVSRRKWLQAEMADSKSHLEWIANRLTTIKNKLEQLDITRCEANQLFIQQLKEHQDALDAIRILRGELARSEQAGEASPVFAQVGKSGFSNKLSEYEHLFEVNAMKEFFQTGKEVSDVAVPKTNADGDFGYIDETKSGASGRTAGGHVDNSRGALQQDSFKSTVDTSDLQGKTLHQKVVAMLNRLEKSLTAGAALLEKNEIAAALDTAQYQIKSDKEMARLRIDRGKRERYIEQLSIDIDVALMEEAEALRLANEAEQDVKDEQAREAAAAEFFEQESERRANEMDALDWVITEFQEQITTLGQELKDRINDYVDDGTFNSNQAHFSRKTTANVARGGDHSSFGFKML